MNVEHIPAEDVDVLPCGADWQSRHPNWSGINAESIRSLCLNTPLPDLPEQPENVQRPGSEVVEKGMLT